MLNICSADVSLRVSNLYSAKVFLKWLICRKLFSAVILHIFCVYLFFTCCHLGLISDCRGDIRKCADYMKRAIQTAELVAFTVSNVMPQVNWLCRLASRKSFSM